MTQQIQSKRATKRMQATIKQVFAERAARQAEEARIRRMSREERIIHILSQAKVGNVIEFEFVSGDIQLLSPIRGLVNKGILEWMFIGQAESFERGLNRGWDVHPSMYFIAGPNWQAGVLDNLIPVITEVEVF